MIQARLQESTGQLKCVIFAHQPILKCTIHSDRPELKGALRASTGIIDTYDGSYEVTPRVHAQTLETEGKKMADDVTVYEIPVTRTSNLQGGLTVLIG